MSSTGYYNPTDMTNPYNEAAELQIGVTDQVGAQKLGAINTLPSSVAAVAVRQKKLTFDLSVNTQVSIPHGLVDENGNAATPLYYSVLESSSNAFSFTQLPDATNIYMTAPAGATTAVTGTVVVFW